MKTILLILSFIFISCEEGSTVGVDSEGNVVVTSVDDTTKVPAIELIVGQYRSDCIDQTSYLIEIKAYSVMIQKVVATNDHCDGAHYLTTGHFNINGGELDYVNTDYLSFSIDRNVCGIFSKKGSDTNIDGIGCSLTMDNLSLKYEGGYKINGYTFTEL